MEESKAHYIEKFQQELTSFGSMPDPLAPYEQKLDPMYGLEVAKAIQHEWFNGGFAFEKSSLFMGRHQWIREMRLYNRAEQDDAKYKAHLARQDEDKELLNMDWNLINVIEKFTNVARNGLSDEYYNIDIRSSDPFAVAAREGKYWEHRKNMATKSMLQKAKEKLGIDMMPRGFIPENEDEIFLYTEIKERPAQESAEEILINFVKETSDWAYIKKECDKDQVLTDMRVVRVYTDPANGVQIAYVDPETYGHSYVERNDFKDAYYHFTVESVTINDLRKTGEFRDDELRDIAKKYAAYNRWEPQTNGNLSLVPLENFVNFDIHVMHFCFRTDKQAVFKTYIDRRNGGINKIARRESTYMPEEGKGGVISMGMDTWFEGSYVVGSNKYIYNYKECENVAFDEQDRALSPFRTRTTNIYKNKLRSFQSNIIPAADQMQYLHLKIQHLAAELKPDLIVIDVDALATLEKDEKGEAKTDNWKQVLSILNVKGVVLKKRINMGEDGMKDAEGARPHPQQQGSALTPLLNLWAHYYNFIRESTGINPALDGTISPDALVGINEMMQLAGNKATKHLVDAATEWDKDICRTISSRIKSIYKDKNFKHLQEMYNKAVGVHNVEAVSAMRDRHLFDFGYTIQLVPTKQELAELKEDLAIAIKEGSIDVSEKAEILRFAKSNMKRASQYMAFLRRRRIEESLRQKQYDFEQQRKTNAIAAQQKLQGDIQFYSAKKSIDLQAAQQEAVIELMKKAQERQIDAPYEQIDFQRDVFLERVKGMADINIKAYMEDRKDDRSRMEAGQNSKMIQQRSLDLPPIDFNKELDIESLLNV